MKNELRYLFLSLQCVMFTLYMQFCFVLIQYIVAKMAILFIISKHKSLIKKNYYKEHKLSKAIPPSSLNLPSMTLVTYGNLCNHRLKENPLGPFHALALPNLK